MDVIYALCLCSVAHRARGAHGSPPTAVNAVTPSFDDGQRECLNGVYALLCTRVSHTYSATQDDDRIDSTVQRARLQRSGLLVSLLAAGALQQKVLRRWLWKDFAATPHSRALAQWAESVLLRVEDQAMRDWEMRQSRMTFQTTSNPLKSRKLCLAGETGVRVPLAQCHSDRKDESAYERHALLCFPKDSEEGRLLHQMLCRDDAGETAGVAMSDMPPLLVAYVLLHDAPRRTFLLRTLLLDTKCGKHDQAEAVPQEMCSSVTSNQCEKNNEMEASPHAPLPVQAWRWHDNTEGTELESRLLCDLACPLAGLAPAGDGQEGPVLPSLQRYRHLLQVHPSVEGITTLMSLLLAVHLVESAIVAAESSHSLSIPLTTPLGTVLERAEETICHSHHLPRRRRTEAEVAWSALLLVLHTGEGMCTQYVRSVLHHCVDHHVDPLQDPTQAVASSLYNNTVQSSTGIKMPSSPECMGVDARGEKDLGGIACFVPSFEELVAPYTSDGGDASPRTAESMTNMTSHTSCHARLVRISSSPAVMVAVALRYPRAQLDLLEGLWGLFVTDGHKSRLRCSKWDDERKEEAERRMGALYYSYAYSGLVGLTPRVSFVEDSYCVSTELSPASTLTRDALSPGRGLFRQGNLHRSHGETKLCLAPTREKKAPSTSARYPAEKRWREDEQAFSSVGHIPPFSTMISQPVHEASELGGSTAMLELPLGVVCVNAAQELASAIIAAVTDPVTENVSVSSCGRSGPLSLLPLSAPAYMTVLLHLLRMDLPSPTRDAIHGTFGALTSFFIYRVLLWNLSTFDDQHESELTSPACPSQRADWTRRMIKLNGVLRTTLQYWPQNLRRWLRYRPIVMSLLPSVLRDTEDLAAKVPDDMELGKSMQNTLEMLKRYGFIAAPRSAGS